jgi:hypothetical protein
MREKATKLDSLSSTVAWRHVALRQLQGIPQTQEGSKFVNCLLRKMEKTCMPQKCAQSKCGCEFKVNFTGIKGSEEVRISKVQLMHGKGCSPPGEQFKAAWATGGHA